MPSNVRIIVLVLAATISAAASGQSFVPTERPAKPMAAVPLAPIPAWTDATNPSQGVRPAAYETPNPLPATSTAPGSATSVSPTSTSSNHRGQAAASPIPLPAHKADSGSTGDGASGKSDRTTRSATPSLVTVVGSLAVVVGLFLVVVWGMRRTLPGHVPTLPKEVVDVLGRAALASRQQVYLLRCGNRLLLVSVTPAGVETLTEIVDPLEVDRLAGLCVQSRPDSTTAAFHQFFHQFAQEPSAPRSRPADPGRGEPLDVAHTRADRPRREDRHG